MEQKNRVLNIFMPILLEIVMVLSGFVIPKLIILYYGSEVNGLVQSVAQFLAITSFFEAGVGRVVQYNLYAPLVNKDFLAVSSIMVSAKRFFRKLAAGLLVYTILLTILYPYIVHTDKSWLYTALLIASMCISSFSQYYFGQSQQLLLNANKKGYVGYFVQIITVLLNTIISIILISRGFGIHIVKLACSLIYLLKPLVLNLYVNRNYKISRSISVEGEPIKQKWNGLAQHVAYVVIDSTDIVVLSLFSTLGNVSIYSVYNLIVSNIKKVFISATGGVEAEIGQLIAQNNADKLRTKFNRIEWALHTCASLVYACTFVLIIPFVCVYTNGITDINYCVPVFAVLITFANYFHTLRLPYSMVILSGGFYKQTQKCYIVAAIINIVSSVLLVHSLGLVGVAIGTIISMLYQNIWMAVYVYKKVLTCDIKPFLKQLFVDLITVLIVGLLFFNAALKQFTYVAWFLLAIKVFLAALLIVVAINAIFYRRNIKDLFIGVRNICSHQDL